MSDRAAWLEDWCPRCGAAPGSRCRLPFAAGNDSALALSHLHPARGWRSRSCPTCQAIRGEACRAHIGRAAVEPHATRLRPNQLEIFDEKVWTELERRELIEAVVTFSTHPGPGGITHSVRLRSHRPSFGYAPNCPTDDELQFALAEPLWAQCGFFAGQSARGEVVWNVQDRRVTVAGTRGGQPFREEVE